MPKFLTKEYRVSSFIDSGNMPTLSADREEKSFASTITDYEGLYIARKRKLMSVLPFLKMRIYMRNFLLILAVDCGNFMIRKNKRILFTQMM